MAGPSIGPDRSGINARTTFNIRLAPAATMSCRSLSDETFEAREVAAVPLRYEPGALVFCRYTHFTQHTGVLGVGQIEKRREGESTQR